MKNASAIALILFLLFTAPARADCTNPAGPAGDMLYNTDVNVPQYCDGTQWIATVPLGGVDLASGLIGHWKLDETSGGTITDYGSGGNDGAWDDNANYDVIEEATAGKIAGALDFDGTDDYVNAGIAPALDLSVFTFAAWVYPALDGNREIVSKGWSLRELRLLNTGVNMQLRGCVLAPTIGCSNSATGTITANTWQHVAMTYDDGGDRKVRLFINGQEVAYELQDAAIGALSGTAGEDFNIGRRASAEDRYFGGSIDDVRIYDRALSAKEVAALYNATGGGDYTSNLVGHWKLDETSGGTITDYGSGGNDGTWFDSADNLITTEAATGIHGGALDFDGAGDYILTTNTDLAQYTASAWIKVRQFAAGDQIQVINRHDGVEGTWELKIDDDGAINHNMYFTDCGTVSYQRFVGSGSVKLDQWAHVAASFDGTNMRTYANGELLDTFDNGGVVCTGNTAPIMIGKRGIVGNEEFFNGVIDDVRIYDRALSAADVKALYLNSAKYCLNPDGVPGQLHYNADTHVPMYCDGDNWIALAPVPGAPADGLLGHWKLDETSGGTITDYGSGGNDGTWTDGVNNDVAEEAATGIVDGALDFDGLNRHINAGSAAVLDDLPTKGGLTVSVWTYARSYGESNLGHIVAKHDYGGGDHGWMLLNRISSTQIEFTAQYDGGTDLTLRAAGANGQPLNEWIHWTVTWDGGNAASGVHIYRDGIEVSSYSVYQDGVGSYQTDSALPLYIGDDPNLARHFDGFIDDVRVYDRPLTAQQVAALYNNTRPPGLLNDPALVAYWPLDEAEGPTANDMAGDNIGYASGGVTFSSTSGQIAGAADFDGVDDYVTAANEANFDFDETQPFSFTAWVNRDTSFSNGDIIIKNTSGPAFTGYGLWMEGDGGSNLCGGVTCTTNCLELYLNNDDASNNKLCATLKNSGVTLGTWHHVAATYDGSSAVSGITLYVDGVAATPTDTFDSLSGSILHDDPLRIGGGPNNAQFDGMIDDVRIYDRVLSAAEIAEIYNAGNAGLAAQDCSNPNAAEGVIIYNLDENAPQYCDGEAWVRLGP